MTMTLEEQFAQVAKEQELNFDREVTAGATYLRLINEYFGPGSNYYSEKETTDDDWDPAQQKVWKYLLTNDHVSYMHLRELLTEIGTASGVWAVTRHCLWMAYFCFCENDEEVDAVLDQAKECGYCADVPVAHVMQFVLFSQPMSAPVVSAIVHADGMEEFALMLWEIVEATGQGFYHTELRQNSLQPT
jgi:hypothetical protein